MKKIIGLCFLWLMPLQSMQTLQISSLKSGWLAESNGDNRVTLFWVKGKEKAAVRTIAVSPEKFDSDQKITITVTNILWSRDGRYLVIGSQEDRVDIWDVENNLFVKNLPSATLIALCAECKKNKGP